MAGCSALLSDGQNLWLGPVAGSFGGIQEATAGPGRRAAPLQWARHPAVRGVALQWATGESGPVIEIGAAKDDHRSLSAWEVFRASAAAHASATCARASASAAATSASASAALAWSASDLARMAFAWAPLAKAVRPSGGCFPCKRSRIIHAVFWHCCLLWLPGVRPPLLLGLPAASRVAIRSILRFSFCRRVCASRSPWPPPRHPRGGHNHFSPLGVHHPPGIEAAHRAARVLRDSAPGRSFRKL